MSAFYYSKQLNGGSSWATIYFIKEGYMLPTHLEQLTWEDVCLEKQIFWSTNYYNKFSVYMSVAFEKELRTQYQNKTNKYILTEVKQVNDFIQHLVCKLEKSPTIKEKIDATYITMPIAPVKKPIPTKKLRYRISGTSSYASFQHGGGVFARLIIKLLKKYSNYKADKVLDWVVVVEEQR